MSQFLIFKNWKLSEINIQFKKFPKVWFFYFMSKYRNLQLNLFINWGNWHPSQAPSAISTCYNKNIVISSNFSQKSLFSPLIENVEHVKSNFLINFPKAFVVILTDTWWVQLKLPKNKKLSFFTMFSFYFYLKRERFRLHFLEI